MFTGPIDLTEIIETKRNLMIRRIKDLEAKYSGDKSETNAKRLRKAITNLRRFDGIINNLPDSLELTAIQRGYGSIAKSLRQEFQQSAKKEFLELILSSEQHRNALERMGVSIPQFEKYVAGMRNRRHGKAKIGVSQYDTSVPDINVDHITDLDCGGDNRPENLWLIPEYLNLVKNVLKEIQINQGEGNHIFVSFKPTEINGENPTVPFIPNGFSLRSSRINFWEPASELFGCNLT